MPAIWRETEQEGGKKEGKKEEGRKEKRERVGLPFISAKVIDM